MLKNPHRILITALGIAWILDALFWRQSSGLSFPLYIGILLAAGFALSYLEGKPAAKSSVWLLFPIVGLALVPAFRLEPMTRFICVCMTLALLMVLAYSFRNGAWLSYSLSGYAAIPFRLLASMFSGAPKIYKQAVQERDLSSGSRKSLRALLPFVRGVFLALPFLMVFGILLSSADAVFAHRLTYLFRYFDLGKLFEYIFRGFYILLLAYVFAGVFLFALTKSLNERPLGSDKPVAFAWIGAVEASVVLGSINLLFFIFVVIQFQYFFGGGENIHIDKLTYAQYARRGFGELIMVACFSLLLFLGLSGLTRKETSFHRKVFSTLGILLGLLVGVILVSAFQRLLLYEAAFGFTRLRTYPHILMLWLGVSLGTFVVLEATGRTRAFGLTLLLAALGFSLTLALLNVDAMIVEKNIERARKGAELDLDYALTLSVDATPILVEIYNSAELPAHLQDQVGALLACQAEELRLESQQATWTGFHFSTQRAERLLSSMASELVNYPVVDRHGQPAVVLGGREHLCRGRWELD